MRRACAFALGCVCWLTLAAPSHAQSLYSLRGFGEEVITAPAERRALGSTSAASRTPGLFGNPALLSFANSTTFTGTFVLDWTESEEPARPEAGDRSDYSSMVTNISILFPFGRTVFGTGLLFDRRLEGMIQTTASVSGQEYDQIYERDGNLLRFPAQIGRTFGDTRVGAGIDVLLFTARSTWRNVFPAGSGFVSSSDVDRVTLWSFEPRVGIVQNVGRRLSLGAWAAWPRELRGDRFLESDDPEDESEDIKFHVEQDLAPSYTVGVESPILDRVRIAVDWTLETWGSVESSLVSDQFEDVNRFGAGLQWGPQSGNGLGRLPVRLGFRTQTLHTLDANGRKVREMTATAGSGLQFSGGNGQFDWSLEYGRRGDDESEFKETFWRIAVTLTGLEKWAGRKHPEDEP